MTILNRLAAPFSSHAGMRAGIELIERGRGAKGFRHLARAAFAGPSRRSTAWAAAISTACVPQSRTEAVRWLERAAQRGHTTRNSRSPRSTRRARGTDGFRRFRRVSLFSE